MYDQKDIVTKEVGQLKRKSTRVTPRFLALGTVLDPGATD